MYKFVLLLFIFPIVFSASLSLESSSDVSNIEEKNKQVLSGEVTTENKNVDPIDEFFNKAILVKVEKFLPHDYQFGPPREKLVAVGSRKSINGELINKRPIIEDELDENTSEIITEKSVTKKTALKSLFKDNLIDYSNQLKDESLHTQETLVQKSTEMENIIHEESLFNGVIEDNSLDKETTIETYLDKEEISSEKALSKQIKIEELLPDEITSNNRLDLDRNLKSDYKEEIEKKLDGWKVPEEKFDAEESIEKSHFRPSLFSVRQRKLKTQEEDNKMLNLKKAITKLKFDLPKIDFESLLKSSQFGGKSTSTDIDIAATTSRDVIPSSSKSVDASIPTKSSDDVAPIIKFVEVIISTLTSLTPKLQTISTTTSTEATSILKSSRQVTSRSKTEEVTSRLTTEETTSRSTTEETTSRLTTEEVTSRSTTKEETSRSIAEEATTRSSKKVVTSKSMSEEATTKSTTKATTRSTTEAILRSTTIEKRSRSSTVVATINSTPIQVTSKFTTIEPSLRSTTIEPSLRSTRASTKFTTEVTTKSTTETILRSTTIVATTISVLRPNKAISKSTTKFTTKSTDEKILRSTTKETTLKSTTKETTLKSTTKETPLMSTTEKTTLMSTTKQTTLKSTTKETTLKSITKVSSKSTTELMFSSRVCGEYCGLDGTFSIKSGLDWSHELDSSSALAVFKNVSSEIVVDLIRIFKHSSIGSSFRSVHINSIYPLSDLIIVDIYLRLHGINLDVTADDVKAVFSEGLVNSTMGRFKIEESRTEFLVSKDRAPRRRVNKMEILDIILPDWAWMGIGVLVVSVSFIGILGIVFACNRRNNIRNVPVVSPYVLANIRKKMSLDGICDDSFTEDIIQDIRSSVSGCSHLHIQDNVSKRSHLHRASVRRGDIIQDIGSSVSKRSHLHRASVRRGEIIQDIGSSASKRSHLHRTGLRDDTVYRSRSRSEGSGTYRENLNREKQGIFSNRDSYRPRAATNNYGLRAAMERDGFRDSYRPRSAMERDGLRDSYRPRAATESYGPGAATESHGPRDSYRPRSATESDGPRDSYRTTGYQRGTSRDLQISHKNVLLNRSNQQISSQSTNANNIYRRQRQSVSRIPGSYNSPRPSVNSYDCRRPSVGSYESRRLSLSSCDSRQQLVSSSDEEVISSNMFNNGSNQRNGNRRGRNDQSRRQVTSGDEETVYDTVLTDESYRNGKQVGKVKRFVYTKDSWSGGVYAVPARKRRTPLPGFEIPRWEEDLPITPVSKSTTESSDASGSSLESPSNMVRMLSYRKI